MKTVFSSLFVIAIFVLLYNNSNAQKPKWLNFTNSENITCLLEDGNELWVGTTGGLVKVNKINEDKEFFLKASNTLPSNNIQALAKDKDGNVWIVTDNGLVKMSGFNMNVYTTKITFLFKDLFVIYNVINKRKYNILKEVKFIK